MRFRKLRIAFSATCLIACVLLILLWVRSYRVVDVVHWTISTSFSVSSSPGVMGASTSRANVDRLPKLAWVTITPMPGLMRSWYYKSDRDGIRVLFPHRLLIAVFATLAAAPWIRQLNWCFSLRTLLIATTLVAVVLGLIVWAAK